jgi:hypothetical protein
VRNKEKMRNIHVSAHFCRKKHRKQEPETKKLVTFKGWDGRNKGGTILSTFFGIVLCLLRQGLAM